MKKSWIEYHDQPVRSPMTRHWYKLNPVAGKGYPVFHVEFDGFEFQFSTLIELDECVAVLGYPLLPPSGQVGSWLHKLPAKTKAWRYRQPAVAYLRECHQAFEHQLIDDVAAPSPVPRSRVARRPKGRR